MPTHQPMIDIQRIDTEQDGTEIANVTTASNFKKIAPHPFEKRAQWREARQMFPGEKNNKILFNLWYFAKDPIRYFNSAYKRYKQLSTDPEKQKKYVNKINSILSLRFSDAEIRKKIQKKLNTSEKVVSAFHPAWGEWLTKRKVRNFPRKWAKDVINVHESLNGNPERQAKFIEKVKSQVIEYGGDTFFQKLDPEQRANFIKRFFAEDIAAAAAAEQAEQQARSAKIKAAFIFGGGFLALLLIAKRRKAA